MAEVLKIRGEYYILTTSSRLDDRTRVLKHGDTFAVFDRHGDIRSLGMGEQGLYHEGTRFLSRLETRIGGERPLLLSSTVRDDNAILAVDLANPDVSADHGKLLLPADTIHVFRSTFLWNGTCYLRTRIRNFGDDQVEFALSLAFEADFADIFEVRGTRRRQHGRLFDPIVNQLGVILRYEGLDGTTRSMHLCWSITPSAASGSEAQFTIQLAPRAEQVLICTAECRTTSTSAKPVNYDLAFQEAGRALDASRATEARIGSSNEQFNDWVNRSIADLRMMTTETPSGLYPYAGVPWYCTAFGRDGIITALETLWFNPEIARGVLAYLAATQASEVLPEQDAEPGKILHETRKGEMAALGEIPFGRYYGTIDATPLFVFLAGAYFDRTGDQPFLERIWPNLEQAIAWIDNYGDVDGDGFVEYERHAHNGLINHGWKDSDDCIFHADGSPAEGPIALAEVQGYVYGAKRAAAELARVLGRFQEAEKLTRQVEALRDTFERAFWCEDLSTYALALDGKKCPCKIRTSNAGHTLLTGIADRKRARRLAQTLLAEDSFSGWGIRTVAASTVRYNPMSYHNGSVWPHDTALIALGLSRYGLKEGVLRILTGLFDASIFVELHRLPELFCGFGRRPGEGPTLYPVACSPQSWAVGSVFLLLEATLGLVIDGRKKTLSFFYPMLPPFLEEIRLNNIAVGDATVDLALRRHGEDVSINVTKREGDVEIQIVK